MKKIVLHILALTLFCSFFLSACTYTDYNKIVIRNANKANIITLIKDYAGSQGYFELYSNDNTNVYSFTNRYVPPKVYDEFRKSIASIASLQSINLSYPVENNRSIYNDLVFIVIIRQNGPDTEIISRVNNINGYQSYSDIYDFMQFIKDNGYTADFGQENI